MRFTHVLEQVYRLICQGSVEDQMLDRIRRKLFLSVKIMGSDDLASSEDASLGLRELMNILRKGSSALSNTNNGLDLERFMKADVAEILALSKSLEKQRDVKVKQDLAHEVNNDDAQLLLDAEEEEKRLLSGVAQVQSRLFEGKLIQRQQTNNSDIAREWQDLQKRARVNRTVQVGGMSFLITPAIETANDFAALYIFALVDLDL